MTGNELGNDPWNEPGNEPGNAQPHNSLNSCASSVIVFRRTQSICVHVSINCVYVRTIFLKEN